MIGSQMATSRRRFKRMPHQYTRGRLTPRPGRRYGDEGWRATFYPAGRGHSVTSAVGSAAGAGALDRGATGCVEEPAEVGSEGAPFPCQDTLMATYVSARYAGRERAVRLDAALRGRCEAQEPAFDLPKLRRWGEAVMSEVNSRSFPALAFPCGHNNPDDNLFCDVCGVRRPSRRSSCQAINRGTANFCGKCGSQLTGSSKLESDLLGSTPGAEDEAWGVPGQISSIESGTATSAPVGGNGRTSGLPAEPRPRNEPQLREDAVALGRSGDAVLASENVERNAPAPLRQRSEVQSEPREPILQDDDESLLDPRLQQFLSERRRVARVRWWGTLAAVTLTILVVAAVLFGAGLGRGRNSLSSAPRLNQPLTPANSEAPAPAIAFQPPAVAESPPAIEQVPAPLPPQPSPPTHAEPTPSRAVAGSTLHGKSDRGATPSRRSGAAVDSAPVMAGSLIAKLGRERAEEAAQTNASWYPPGSETFLYWQRVANAVRSGVAGPSATAPPAYYPGPSYWDPVRGAHIDPLSGQPLVGR